MMADGSGSESPRAPVDRNWRWKVSVFLLLATALSYLDRQALSVVGPQVQKELNLDNAQLGTLFSAFLYTYGAMHLVVGFFLDRYNIRKVYAAFVALWSTAQIFSGLAPGFNALFAGRMALGTFEAAGQTGAARIIARIFEGKDRAFANGVMMSGGALGALIAGPLMIFLSSSIGWRGGFVVLGVMGIFWSLAFFLWFRPSEEVLYGNRVGGSPFGKADEWRVIGRNPKFWACIVSAMFGLPIIHVAGAWIPTYFVQTWNLSLNKELATYLVLVYIGQDLGFIGGGALVSVLIRRGFSIGAARKIVCTAAVVLMLGAIAVPYAPAPLYAVAMIASLNMGRAAWGAIYLAFNQDIAPGRVAMMAGLFGAIGSFSAAIFTQIIGNISGDRGFGIPFMLIGCMAVLSLIPLLMVRWDEGTTSTQGRVAVVTAPR